MHVWLLLRLVEVAWEYSAGHMHRPLQATPSLNASVLSDRKQLTFREHRPSHVTANPAVVYGTTSKGDRACVELCAKWRVEWSHTGLVSSIIAVCRSAHHFSSPNGAVLWFIGLYQCEGRFTDWVTDRPTAYTQRTRCVRREIDAPLYVSTLIDNSGRCISAEPLWSV